MFEETIVKGTLIEYHIEKGFMQAVMLYFKVPNSKKSKLIQYCAGNYDIGIKFLETHKVGDKVNLVKVGKGIYAGYRIAED